MNENRKNSYLISSTGALGKCTACCPFDAKNIPHPSMMNRTDMGIINDSDTCCLSKLQVDCHIQCPKKKKKNKQYHSSQSIQRTISSSSSSQLSPNPKRKKISSTNSTKNDDFDTQTSSSSLSISTNTNTSEQSLLSNQSKKNSKYHQKSTNAQQYDKTHQSRLHINESIQNLKTSIDNLTQFIVHRQKSSQPTISFLDRFRRFFTLFKSNDNQLNEECCQILQCHHLTKENLISIYNLFDRNEQIFLSWLRTIMPEYFLPLLLNYVKHFHSISTDND